MNELPPTFTIVVDTAAAPAWIDARDEFCRWLAAGDKLHGTRRLRRYHLERLERHTPGIGPWDVTESDLVSFLGQTGWSTETRRSYLTTCRTFYAWAAAVGRCPENPAAALASIRARRGIPRPTPEAVLRQSLEQATPRVRLMVSLAAYEGLRRGEISRVRGADVLQAYDGTYELIVAGKGGVMRSVPLVDEIADRILMHGEGWTFPGQIEGHLSPEYVGKLVSRALPGDWTAHTLRHRFATATYAVERDIRAVQDLLGHADVRTTQIYTAVPSGAKRRAVLGAAA
ncbi:tyrosine-type recombinase/integrase [Gordonia malaquae]|uniref:tyrosine-type recombinase/integrase n=1 Tax=Gordonia malaquae TaxID=410332 RepID=UPI003015C7DA